MLQIYDKLLAHPLFIGIGKDELEHIVATTKLGFISCQPETTIIKRNDKVSQLYFLLNGKISIEHLSDNYKYSIIEYFSAPLLILPERLFGAMKYSEQEVKTNTLCSLLTIDKNELLKLIENHIIVRLNYLNILSSIAQRNERIKWKSMPQDIKHKIYHFIKLRCISPIGEKKVKINMQELAEQIRESRLNVSKLLNNLHKEGSILLKRSEIIVQDLEKLS